MIIRPMTEADLPAAAALIRALSLEFFLNDCSAEAVAVFTRENDEHALRRFMHAGTRYYVAEVDQAMAGFVAMRDNRHLFHMFVAKQHHRKGLAWALWRHARQCAIEQGNGGLFTLNASSYAVPVYERMGFVRTAPTQYKNDIPFNPMELDENADD